MVSSPRDEEVVAAKRQKLKDGHDAQNGKTSTIVHPVSVNEDDDDEDNKPIVFKRREATPFKQKVVNDADTTLKRPSLASTVKPARISTPETVKRSSSVGARSVQDDKGLLASTGKSAGTKPESKPLVKTVSRPSTSASMNLNNSSQSKQAANHPSGSISKSNLPLKSKTMARSTPPSSSQKPGVSAAKASISDAGKSKPAAASQMLANDDYSDDNMPLASRYPNSTKSKPTKEALQTKPAKEAVEDATALAQGNNALKVMTAKPIDPSDDSDDDKPLAYRAQLKVAPVPAPADDDSDDDKPLAERKPMKTYVRKEVVLKTVVKVESGSKKRVAEAKASTSTAPPEKKLKVTTSSAVKSEPKEVDSDDDDAEDDVPLLQRIPSTGLGVKKTVTVQQKAKSSSSSGATANNAKKFLEQRKAKTLQVKKLVKKKKVMKVTRTTKTLKEPGSGEEQKWQTLEHSGVIFPPPYEPHGIKMLYDGKPVSLTPEQEEVATMFAVMKDSEYATKKTFISNFWNDWKPILGSKHVIKKLDLCDFTPIYDWFQREKEKKKSMTAEEKKRLREEKLKVEERYMWALVDGVKEKVGNFRVEPPGLFRGRGDHPKMGKLKARIYPEDIVINIGKEAPVPECPMPGHRWKQVKHDNTVTWLAFWNDPINSKDIKYVFLAASSTLKGQSDMQKYEKARMLKDHIEKIRRTYTKDFAASDPTRRQIAVATYLIDRLALRAGNEKDEDEAETVGCCSLKVEHVTLVPPNSLQFDFLGKDSIRYFNTVEVDERVYKAIGQFRKGKKGPDDLFEMLDTTKLNLHLKGIMPGLTAKVFRTYNASITLDNLLQSTTGDISPEKIADYQRANKEVAILCNHQRSVSKTHSAQMERLEGKLTEMQALVEELETDLERAKKGKPPLKDSEGKVKKTFAPETLEKRLVSARQRAEKMRLDMSIKDDLKTVALGTSKINYMDPRITVAWCKQHEVPIEKIFNKSLLAKFAWAMDVEPDFRF